MCGVNGGLYVVCCVVNIMIEIKFENNVCIIEWVVGGYFIDVCNVF